MRPHLVANRTGAVVEHAPKTDTPTSDRGETADQLREMIDAARDRVQRSRDLVQRIERQQTGGE